MLVDALGDRHGVGKDTVARIWKARNLRPWRVDTFKLSNDPNFEAKLVDVVGLYLDPPERAVVFSFDEKTQCQALDRTQPSLPLKPGRGRTMTHDYRRHGTVDLFAAMNIATGEVLHDTRRSHAGADVLGLQVDRSARAPRPRRARRVGQPVRPQVRTRRRWLADRSGHVGICTSHRHPSWLNLIEGWFSVLTRKALRDASFTSTRQLEAAIDVWASHWNDDPQPFVWTKTVDDIISKVKRGRATLDHLTESATHH